MHPPPSPLLSLSALPRPAADSSIPMAAATAAVVPAATAAEDEARCCAWRSRRSTAAAHWSTSASPAGRCLRARCPAHVVRVGLALLNDASASSRLASEQWTLYKQVAVAAMDCQRLDMGKWWHKFLIK